MKGERIARVDRLLKSKLNPEHLEILDESHQHSGHGNETHLRVVVVSSAFEGKSRVQRQQTIYALLADELGSGLHALALRTLTPSEWQSEGGADQFSSPPCHGGSKLKG